MVRKFHLLEIFLGMILITAVGCGSAIDTGPKSDFAYQNSSASRKEAGQQYFGSYTLSYDPETTNLSLTRTIPGNELVQGFYSGMTRPGGFLANTEQLFSKFSFAQAKVHDTGIGAVATELMCMVNQPGDYYDDVELEAHILNPAGIANYNFANHRTTQRGGVGYYFGMVKHEDDISDRSRSPFHAGYIPGGDFAIGLRLFGTYIGTSPPVNTISIHATGFGDFTAVYGPRTNDNIPMINWTGKGDFYDVGLAPLNGNPAGSEDGWLIYYKPGTLVFDSGSGDDGGGKDGDGDGEEPEPVLFSVPDILDADGNVYMRIGNSNILSSNEVYPGISAFNMNGVKRLPSDSFVNSPARIYTPDWWQHTSLEKCEETMGDTGCIKCEENAQADSPFLGHATCREYESQSQCVDDGGEYCEEISETGDDGKSNARRYRTVSDSYYVSRVNAIYLKVNENGACGFPDGTNVQFWAMFYGLGDLYEYDPAGDRMLLPLQDLSGTPGTNPNYGNARLSGGWGGDIFKSGTTFTFPFSLFPDIAAATVVLTFVNCDLNDRINGNDRIIGAFVTGATGPGQYAFDIREGINRFFEFTPSKGVAFKNYPLAYPIVPVATPYPKEATDENPMD